MSIEIDRESVRGDLPDYVFNLINWERLTTLSYEAVLGQDHGPRKKIIDCAGEAQVFNFEIAPFDAEGWTTVRYEGRPILRLHVTRLFPFASLSGMKQVDTGPTELR